MMEENENLYENLNTKKYLNKDQDLLTSYRLEQVASYQPKILRIFLI